VRAGEVALVHRPIYGDWSLPKGRLEAGEDDVAAALREVREETGFAAEITADLGTVTYPVVRRGETLPKTVHFFLMQAGEGRFAPHEEVDQLLWLAPAEAAEKLSYDREREVLARAIATGL
jgi:8-oxo-dGTP pyrophosphatase MutT (NUDIX family)